MLRKIITVGAELVYALPSDWKRNKITKVTVVSVPDRGDIEVFIDGGKRNKWVAPGTLRGLWADVAPGILAAAARDRDAAQARREAVRDVAEYTQAAVTRARGAGLDSAQSQNSWHCTDRGEARITLSVQQLDDLLDQLDALKAAGG